jgi:hypothetical protein
MSVAFFFDAAGTGDPKVKAFWSVLCMAVLVCACLGQDARPTKHPVRNAKAATRIAEAELIRTYGAVIKSERPFTAKLENGIWHVVSTQNCQENMPYGIFCQGGHWVHISSDDGRILGVGAQQPPLGSQQ